MQYFPMQRDGHSPLARSIPFMECQMNEVAAWILRQTVEMFQAAYDNGEMQVRLYPAHFMQHSVD